MFFIPRHQHQTAKKLPKPVYDYMKHRFIFMEEYLDTLRCFEFDGLVNGKEVTCVRIFSPRQARDRHIVINNRPDLDKYENMLLFEGHIDRQGNAYVADRRAPAKRDAVPK